MTSGMHAIRRALLPAGVFVVVAAAHFTWLGLFPERDPAQDRWAAIAAVPSTSWLHRYVETQSYWLGFSYALSLAFAAHALRRYREERHCAARNLAVGGITFSGFLAVLGCYLLGCCGSPMLAVYLNLFGAAFLPLAKPLVAGLTTALTAGAWWWMRRQAHTSSNAPSNSACEDPSCKR
jgi:hypothetical protein